MTSIEDLMLIPTSDLADTQRIVGAIWAEREVVTGYQSLKDLEVLDGEGARIFVRGDEVVLVYVGEAGLPPGLRSETVSDLVGSDGELLRSREGRRARLHVVADKGVTWSELDGEVGFVELYPPTTVEDYQQRIYLPPPGFVN